MRKFLINSSFFAFILGISFFIVFYLADGKADEYYLKVTTPLQQSMILGTSKAAQGLQPKIFDSILFKNKDLHFYNYSFSNADSPYGATYFNSIKKKLDPETKNAIFVVTVDPWSISTIIKEDDSVNFFEENGVLADLYSVSMNPNIFYLINSYQIAYFQILAKKITEKREYLKKDGWLEIKVPMDSASIAKRTEAKISLYVDDMLGKWKYSEPRMRSFTEMIEFLQKHGSVYLVRLPLTEKIFEVEDRYMPDFDDKMQEVCEKYDMQYLNYRVLPHVYNYTDGNHLYKTSGAVVSAEIAEWIAADQEMKRMRPQ